MDGEFEALVHEINTICVQNKVECIMMFAGDGISGGSVHINPGFQRFRTFHTPLYRNERVFDPKNSQGIHDIRPKLARLKKFEIKHATKTRGGKFTRFLIHFVF